MDPHDDEIEQLRAGDASVCEKFVRRHAVDLYGWLYRLTGCREEAEDLAQEALAAFWVSIRRKKPPVEGHVWLFSIARNLWRQHCRRAARRPRPKRDALDSVPSSERSALEILEHDEMVHALELAVAGLDVELREVFSLRMWHHWNHAEIAAIQNVSPGLVRWRFFRARQILRERLGHWFDTCEQSHD